MIKGIIFDCFGVLIANDLQMRVRAVEAVDAEAGQKLHDTMKARDRGMLERREYIIQMAEIMKIDPTTLEKGIDESITKNTELIDFIHTLRPQYKLAMLSNVSGRDRLDELFKPGELDELFDIVVASGDVGIIKPEREIYELTVGKLGLVPEDCVMIDDLEKYCAGAEAVGIRAIQFKSTDQAVRELRSLIDTTSETY